jgi:hypothetical protein
VIRQRQDALGFIARSIGLGDCRRHQPHGRIYIIQRLKECSIVAEQALFGSDFQRFMEGPGRAFGNEKN